MDELLRILAWVSLVNRAVTRPVIQKKTGLTITSAREDFGQIVTTADLGVSQAMLKGGVEGTYGLQSIWPGSFTEEQDTSDRRTALKIFEVDPIDGTGDFVDTYQRSRVMPPTTLVSRLERRAGGQTFSVTGGIVFDIVNEYAIVSDCRTIGLYAIGASGPRHVQLKPADSSPFLSLGRRISYPQLVADGPFRKFARKKLDLRDTPAGGAGLQLLQFVRSLYEPVEPGAEAFKNLTPLSLIFTCQPDWKTWDTDPARAIAQALSLKEPTDVFGETLSVNPASEHLSDMHHKTGFVLYNPSQDGSELLSLARQFAQQNPNCELFGKDYDYKNAIRDMYL